MKKNYTTMSKNKNLKEPIFKTFKERIEYEQQKW